MHLPDTGKSAEAVMVEWSEALSVGHRVIDDQHRDLIVRVNALNAAISAGDAAERITIMAAEFFSAYKAHAAFEELAMHQLFYASVERHAEHHTMHLDALTTLMSVEPLLEAIRINLPFINSAVFDHIERDDRDFATHLKAIGLYGRV